MVARHVLDVETDASDTACGRREADVRIGSDARPRRALALCEPFRTGLEIAMGVAETVSAATAGRRAGRRRSARRCEAA